LCGKNLEQTAFNKILLIRLSAIGDVVHCLPALDALRRRYPNAHIAWAVEEAASSLLEGHPQLNEVIVLPRKSWARSLGNPLKWPGLIGGVAGFFSKMHGHNFDLSIDFQGNFRSGLVSWLSGAKVRLGRGRGHSKEGSHVFATHHHIPPARVHRVERALGLVELLGVDTADAKGIIPIDPRARESVAKWLAGIKEEENGRLVVMHPGTSAFGALKKWDWEKYSDLAKRLVREDGRFVVLTWGNEREKKECDLIAGAAGERVYAAPTMSLRELVALIDKAVMFIGVDTGPLHIAAALGTRVLGLYGPKDPVIYGPYGEGHIIVRSGVPCSPCTLRHCEEVICMKKLAVKDVHLAAKKILADKNYAKNPSAITP